MTGLVSVVLTTGQSGLIPSLVQVLTISRAYLGHVANEAYSPIFLSIWKWEGCSFRPINSFNFGTFKLMHLWSRNVWALLEMKLIDNMSSRVSIKFCVTMKINSMWIPHLGNQSKGGLRGYQFSNTFWQEPEWGMYAQMSQAELRELW